MESIFVFKKIFLIFAATWWRHIWETLTNKRTRGPWVTLLTWKIIQSINTFAQIFDYTITLINRKTNYYDLFDNLMFLICIWDWLLDWIVVYVVSAIFQPYMYNRGVLQKKSFKFRQYIFAISLLSSLGAFTQGWL